MEPLAAMLDGKGNISHGTGGALFREAPPRSWHLSLTPNVCGAPTFLQLRWDPPTGLYFFLVSVPLVCR